MPISNIQTDETYTPMKKYLFLGLMAVLATSCEKDPDLSKLDNNFTVYTNYDSKTNFNDFKEQFSTLFMGLFD